MLNFAEQTGSGAVIVVWSFLMHSMHPTIQVPMDITVIYTGAYVDINVHRAITIIQVYYTHNHTILNSIAYYVYVYTYAYYKL